ncbi:MAG: ferritin family protein [Nitrospinae bacterium]|nr:ferritin family protein [Nitrospinota bacterium]
MKETKIETEFGKDSAGISFQCVDAIEISLFIEKEGFGFYEKAAKNVSDPRVKDMFSRLAEEEKEHIQTLQTKVQFLKPAISGKGKTRRRVDSFVREELKGKIFPASETNMVKKFKNDVEALDYGIESEKRSIEILNRLLLNEKKLDVKAVFSHLMVEEKKHLALLEDLKKKM